MRHSSVLLVSIVLGLVAATPPVSAKEGVKATVHTPISASAIESSKLHVTWSLTEEKTGEPFSACAVFIRLVGPTGESNEAFSECGLQASKGTYDASPTVPSGGINRIEIGVAGTVTDREGNSDRSDWLIPLTNNPMLD